MRDAELYQTILGLSEPWSVGRVQLDVDVQRVDIWVEHESGARWPCAVCGESLGCYDHAQERVWRHLDTCQYQTHLHARIPRVNYCKLRITNGVAEGLNSKIMTIKRLAAGFRNREHFKTAIYFHCGGLDLYPR